MSYRNPVEFLKDNQSYLKRGDERVAERLDISASEAENAKAQAKADLESTGDYRYSSAESNTQSESTSDEEPEGESTENESKSTSEARGRDVPPSAEDAYYAHLEDLGITEEDVDSVKYWQTMGGEHRFSVVQKYEEEEVERQSFLDLLEEQFAGYEAPEVSGSSDVVGRGNLGIINLYDAHLDKLALAEETNEEFDVSMEDNITRFECAFMDFLNTLEKNGITRAHFPLGHDMFNTNGDMHMTKNGTKQRVNVPWQTAYTAGTEMVRRCIDAARQVLDDLEVIMVPGNHAPDKTFYLGTTMEHLYRNADDVTVDNDRKARKYRLEGDVLLGYSHGHETKSQKRVERLPLNMAVEAEDRWSEADFRVMFLGDIHHKKKYKILSTVDSVGCEVNFLRSIGPQNDYEFDNGFTGVPKTAQLDIFSPDGKNRWHQEKSWR